VHNPKICLNKILNKIIPLLASVYYLNQFILIQIMCSVKFAICNCIIIVLSFYRKVAGN